MTTIGTIAHGRPGRVAPPAGPAGYPLFGVLPQVRRDPLNFFLRVSQSYGDVVPIPLGPQRVYLVNSATLVERVLQGNAANYQKSKLFKRLAPMLGDGLITSDGDVWRRQRRTSQPAFSGKALGAMQAQMAEATRDMLTRWDERWMHETEFDVSVDMMHLALDIALRSLFGIRLNRDDFARVYEAVSTFLRIVDRHIWSPVFAPIQVPTPRNLRYRHAIQVLEEIFGKIIAQRRTEATRDDDLLGYLLREYGSSAEDERLLRDLVISVLLAAHETTAASLSWTWYLLGKFPAAGVRAAEEATSVLSGRPPGFDDLAELKFIHAAYQESLRLYPPIWTFSRDAVDEDMLGGTYIPRGATLMVCIHLMHHDRRYWEAPEGFLPERFVSDTGSRPRYAYFPFGGGPRTCIGARFATLEALTVLGMVLPHYELEIVPGRPVEPDPMITLRPRHGIWVRLRARR